MGDSGERGGGRLADFNGLADALMRCGGMTSPRVRDSFAMRLRRISAAVGNIGVVGVWIVEADVGVLGVLGEVRLTVDGVVGVVGADGSGQLAIPGSESSRRRSGPEISLVVRRFVMMRNFIEHFSRRGRWPLGWLVSGVRDTPELAKEGEAYMRSGEPG